MIETTTKTATGVRLFSLWKNKRQDGSEYLSGKLSTGATVMLVKNKFKEEGSKQPDFVLVAYPPRPKDDGAGTGTTKDNHGDTPF